MRKSSAFIDEDGLTKWAGQKMTDYFATWTEMTNQTEFCPELLTNKSAFCPELLTNKPAFCPELLTNKSTLWAELINGPVFWSDLLTTKPAYWCCLSCYQSSLHSGLTQKTLLTGFVNFIWHTIFVPNYIFCFEMKKKYPTQNCGQLYIAFIKVVFLRKSH